MPDPPRSISTGYRLDAPRRIWTDIMSEWSKLRDADGNRIPFPFELACMSYRLDCDAGTLKSIRDYGRIWAWGRKGVEHRLPDIRAEVESWGVPIPERTDGRGGRRERSGDKNDEDSAENDDSGDKNEAPPEGGQKWDKQGDKAGAKVEDEGGQTGDKKAPEIPEKAASRDKDGTDAGEAGGQRWDKQGDKAGTHTKQPLPPPQGNNSVGVSARAGMEGGPRDPQVNPPELDDVLAWAEMNHVPRTDAEEIFTFYVSRAWRDKNMCPIRDWGYAILDLINYRKRQQHGNGTHNRTNGSRADDGEGFSSRRRR